MAHSLELTQPNILQGTNWKPGSGTPSSASLARMAALGGARSAATRNSPVPKWAANLRQALRHERARDGLIDLSSKAELHADFTSQLRNAERKAGKSRKPKRHWSDGSTTSSETLQRDGRQDIIERMSSVTWSALRIMSIFGAVGVTACVVARRCFGIDSVTIGWDWN